MAFWRNWLSAFTATPAPAKPAARAAPRVKSAERIRNEQFILDTRRQILARIDAEHRERVSKETVTEAIDRDTVRAAQVVKRMLLDLEAKGKP